MEFLLAESVDDVTPHPMSLHYLVPPGLLILPEFSLLEDINPSSLDELLEIIKGISEMVLQGGEVGIGYKRVAYRDRWGIVGELDSGWAYRQLVEEGNPDGVFLSPQLMIAYSQGRKNPRCNVLKADMFALGIMLVEIVFQEKMDYIFDYENFEVHLNPLLEKLERIKEEYGEQVGGIFVAMLEIEEEGRIDFPELLEVVDQLLRPQPRIGYMASSNHSQRMETSKGGRRTPTKNDPRAAYSPRNHVKFRNDLSPLRERFGPNPRVRRTPERQNSRSPLRRELKINTDANFVSARLTPREQGLRQNFSPIGRR